MFKKHIKRLGVISSVLALLGLILMFSSASFGIYLGSSWLINQEGSIADTSQYMMVNETFSNAYLVTGGILFAAGLLTAILTYFSVLFLGFRETEIPPEHTD
ncbi:hypothetical protein A1A1_16675 [Planococcus antarcticus DSM 14505]|uniref:Uncharacterized protein n=1 Tax=Planococcus antarcticus DSM 14505 TaxID=1185653 RepID=A0AA87IHY9_9BACL|nr:hypothetical protein [Planococcus antarcticus]EIM05375.1 hypothetical protein A1A1_16675 [Planococcus antarcticus DSM 14505]